MNSLSKDQSTPSPELFKLLKDIIDDNGDDEQQIAMLMRKVLKNHLLDGRAVIRERFENGKLPGKDAAREIASLVDDLIRVLYRIAVDHSYLKTNHNENIDHLSVIAVGGYGRAEMAPFSDIDLLFLLPIKQSSWCEKLVEYLLYVLWDLGLKIGHSTRNISECISLSENDFTIRTSILEARYICGDQQLSLELRKKFKEKFSLNTGPSFVEAKLQERDKRHLRLGDSRYLVEPNVKDGKGGLRDLHTLFWIAKYLYNVEDIAELVDLDVFTLNELKRFSKAENFLWAVRIQLHMLAGRAEERITFDFQSDLGSYLGYKAHIGTQAVERFMKHYYLNAKEVGDLTRIFCAILEDRHRPTKKFGIFRRESKPQTVGPFIINRMRVDVNNERIFEKDSINLLRLFHLAQERSIDIHPNALRLVTQNLGRVDHELRDNKEAGKLFIEILTSRKDPEKTLRRMNESGVLGRFLPDFGRVVAQSQYDMYHVYTVDEHTIRAIGILSELENGNLAEEHPLSDRIVNQILSRRTLYLSVLLHDIAKGRGGDHSVLGAEVAQKVGPFLGLENEETETVAWLVLHHLDMSRTAFRRDLSDPKTISDFSELVQSPERLRLLLILTVVDIRAVGPGRWNGWSGQLLRDLYYLSEEKMAGGDSLAGSNKDRVEKSKKLLADRLKVWGIEEKKSYISKFYPNYWATFDLECQERHANFLRKFKTKSGVLEIDARVDKFRAVTELTIYTSDHAGLFAGITGAMAVSRVNIVSARIITTKDGMALESLWVQGPDGAHVDGSETIHRLKNTIEQVLTSQILPIEIISKDKDQFGRTHVFTVEPRVLVDNNASDSHTVIEVNGRDRRGLLHMITKALLEFGVTISSARIATYGERAVDVFYIQDLIGYKITSEVRLKKLRAILMEILESNIAYNKILIPADHASADR